MTVVTKQRYVTSNLRRSSQVIVRVTLDEKARLAAKARAAHMTVSDYARCALLRDGDSLVDEVGRLRALVDTLGVRAQEADRRAMRALGMGKE